VLEKILEAALEFLLSEQSEAQRAKVAAHLLAPALVMGIAISGVYSLSVGFDFGSAITVAELRTQVDTAGHIVQRPGLALIVEPTETEYRVPLKTSSSIRTSLDEQTTRINDDRLVLTQTEFRGQSPLVGVSAPVTVVIDGESQGDIWVPGGKFSLANRRIEPRRAIAFVSIVLLVCIFAFGMSFATVFPLKLSVNDTTAELGTDPDHH